ncbi:hypothetical protein BDQ17DRAFT_720910 [Cyathus striatus]|nr:hypothetical protein BDQ17DRAFT_720910 [Cyathus striatus]
MPPRRGLEPHETPLPSPPSKRAQSWCFIHPMLSASASRIKHRTPHHAPDRDVTRRQQTQAHRRPEIDAGHLFFPPLDELSLTA